MWHQHWQSHAMSMSHRQSRTMLMSHLRTCAMLMWHQWSRAMSRHIGNKIEFDQKHFASATTVPFVQPPPVVQRQPPGSSSRVTQSPCDVCCSAIRFAQQGEHGHAFWRGGNSYILNFSGPTDIPSFVWPFPVVPRLPPDIGSHAKLLGCNMQCGAIQFGLRHGDWYAGGGGGFFFW